jgi:hypothetical protein
MTSTSLTSGERADLLRVTRLRMKVAKTAVAQRSAELLAEFERQLAAIYTFDQSETWQAAANAAAAAVDSANKVVAEECRRMGIPERFAPSIAFHWFGRGENATKDRRAELRKVATSRVEALEKGAIAEIERHSAEVQTKLLAIGMSSEAAALLASLPSAEQLMPPISVGEAEALLGSNGRARLGR